MTELYDRCPGCGRLYAAAGREHACDRPVREYTAHTDHGLMIGPEPVADPIQDESVDGHIRRAARISHAAYMRECLRRKREAAKS
jgi:hypothetical protein